MMVKQCVFSTVSLLKILHFLVRFTIQSEFLAEKEVKSYPVCNFSQFGLFELMCDVVHQKHIL